MSKAVQHYGTLEECDLCGDVWPILNFHHELGTHNRYIQIADNGKSFYCSTCLGLELVKKNEENALSKV